MEDSGITWEYFTMKVIEQSFSVHPAFGVGVDVSLGASSLIINFRKQCVTHIVIDQPLTKEFAGRL